MKFTEPKIELYKLRTEMITDESEDPDGGIVSDDVGGSDI